MRVFIFLTALTACVDAFYPYFPNQPESSTDPLTGLVSGVHQLSAPPHPHLRTRSEYGTVDAAEGIKPLSFPITRQARRGTMAKRDNNFPIVVSDDPFFDNSAAVDQDGTDLSYMVDVKLGGKSATFHMLLDTAATSSWIMGSTCKTDSCALHDTFGPEDGAVTVQTGKSFAVSYGTGSVSGKLCRTKAELAGLSTTWTLALVDDASPEFSYYDMDGILGLGRQSTSASVVSTPNLLGLFKKAGLIKRNVFGIRLSRASDGQADGELNIGAANPDLHSGSLAWHATQPSSRGFWQLALTGVSVGTGPRSTVKLQPISGSTARTAILDTGTSFLLIPSVDAQALHALIPGAAPLEGGEQWSVPCAASAPMFLSFTPIAGPSRRWRIDPTDYVGIPLTGDPETCNSNIIGRAAFGPRQWLVGDVFLKNVYTVFDADRGRIGFGVLADGGVASGQNKSASQPSPTSNGDGDGDDESDGPSRTASAFSEVSGTTGAAVALDGGIASEGRSWAAAVLLGASVLLGMGLL